MKRLIVVSAVLAMLSPTGNAAAVQYALQGVGSLGPVTVNGIVANPDSFALDINDGGAVVGQTSCATHNAYEAFVFDGTSSSLVGLGFLGTTSRDESIATAISGDGKIAGFSASSLSYREAFLWNGTTLTGLGCFEPDTISCVSEAEDVNNSGWVVGQSAAEGFMKAFLWHDGVMRNLGVLSGDRESNATAINRFGTVVGVSLGSQTRAFIWDEPTGVPGELTPLYADGGAEARDINDLGQIVGSSFTGSVSNSRRAVLWDAVNVVTDLGLLPGAVMSDAHAINNAGQVLGTCEIPDIGGGSHTEYFVWDRTNGMAAILPRLDETATGWTIQAIAGINAAGKLVGYGVNPEGYREAFILTPHAGVDADHDGYSVPEDCDDQNAAINPGATDFFDDGIDQDCNGYDLTISATATWSKGKKTVSVVATSKLGAAAALKLDTYGVPLVWSAKKQNWTATKRDVGANPGTVVVSGTEGSVSVTVATVK